MFGYKYDQNIFRNELPDHENIGLDTSIEFLGARGCVLCHYACEIMESEPFLLPQNGYLGAIQCVWVWI